MTIKNLRLTLAAKVEDIERDIKFPVFASYKIDGIRAMLMDGKVMSRSLKPLPNKYIQDKLGPLPKGTPILDGEIVVGDPNAKDVYNVTSSAVMSQEGTPDFKFYLFDYFYGNQAAKDALPSYEQRYQNILDMDILNGRIIILQQWKIKEMSVLRQFQKWALLKGYEGVMLRSPDSPYKNGRSTLKQNYLLKLKAMSRSEAEIIAFQQFEHNANEATTNESGYTERSTKKEGKVKLEALGAFIVRDLVTGIEFKVGTGYTESERSEFWKRKDELLGKIITYEHFKIGVKDKPRFPVFKGFREIGT